MYVIYTRNEHGELVYFTGRTEKSKGTRKANMTRTGNVKLFSSVNSVIKARKKLEKNCISQSPFIATTAKAYIRDRWGV